MRSELIASLVRYWCLADWQSYNETIADMTYEELGEAASMLHLMASSMYAARESRRQQVEQKR